MDVLLLWVTAMEGSEEYVRGEEDEEVVELDVFLAIKNRTRQTDRQMVSLGLFLQVLLPLWLAFRRF